MLKYAAMLEKGEGAEPNEDERQRYIGMSIEEREPDINIECSIC